MHDRSRYCENKLVSRTPWTTTLWCTACILCLIIASLAQQAVFAQDVDTLRKGVVKVVATADGKQKTGAGFIIKDDAQTTYIVTASHVVAGDKYPKVAFFSQRHSLIETEVLLNDARNDISLLKVRDHTQEPPEIRALPFSTSEGVKDNEELIAIGFPAGGGSWAAVRVTLAARQGADLILDGNIDEGNSGGPVLKNGKIVGLVANADKFGRAIPEKIITMVLEGWGITLAKSGEVSVKNTTAHPPRRDSPPSTPTTTRPSTATRLPFEPEMVRIPPGKYLMGSPENESEGFAKESPQHEVTIAYAFEISKYEVTFDEYDAFAKATHRKLPHTNQGRARRPVADVSFNDAQAYVQWLSQQTGKQYRLPTEAEWEYAARAGTHTRYWWGDDIGNNNAVCRICGSQGEFTAPVPVGSLNANAFGLYDTAGNVWEWTQDCWHKNFTNAPSDGSAWLEANGGDCTLRVLRGGGISDFRFELRSASRSLYPTTGADNDIGFRIVRTL